MRIITCNVRASTMAQDLGPRLWKNRKDLCFEVILKEKPDVICLQECQMEQLQDFQAALETAWGAFWMRLAPDGGPENVIFYRKDFARILDHGGYWLSSTPHIPASKSWGSECVRLANFVVLETAEDTIRVINTHTDHASQTAREKQTQMIIDESASWGDMPQILTGDLNCDVHNPAVQLLLQQGWRDTHFEAAGIRDERFTAHDFLGESWQGDRGICGSGKMDWIMVKGALRSVSSRLVMDHIGELYPSDHYFVSAEIRPE